MKTALTPHEQIEELLQQRPKVGDIKRMQDRAGTMAAVTATIIGIGVPLLIQSQDHRYFHKIPLIMLVISFFAFYFTFTRAAISFSHFHISGVDDPEEYKLRTLEKVMSFTYAKKPKSPLTLTNQLEKQIIWMKSFLQIGHACFVTAFVTEFWESMKLTRSVETKTAHIVIAVIVFLGFRLFYFSATKYTNTETLRTYDFIK